MNLQTLQLYCDIVRLQSFSRGARANQVTQSAASQSIQQLEATLGVKLIDRSKRPFAVTAQGQRYYDGVRPLLSDYRRIEGDLKRASAAVSGSFQVAAIYSVGLYDLPVYMRRYMSDYPQAKVRVEFLRPNKVYEAVVSEEADLGIMSYARKDRSINVLPWRSEKMAFVCHPNHRLATRNLVNASDLTGENLIAFDPDLPIRKAIDHSLKQHHSQVNIVMEFDNIETIKQAVEIGAGVAILPEPTVRRAADGIRMVSVPLAMPELVRPVCLIYRRQKPLTPAVQNFIALLQNTDTREPK